MPLCGQQHVERYRATDGEEGHDWQGTQTLLLTTTGRKSGEPHTTPLIYAQHGNAYTIVASKGGSDAPPAWYLNLSENPEVEVQVKGDRFKALHHRLSNAFQHHDRDIVCGLLPVYNVYDEHADIT